MRALWLLASLISLSPLLVAQEGSGSAAPKKPASLQDFARHLPDYLDQNGQIPARSMSLDEKLDHMTAAEREAVVPEFVRWLDDADPKVRRAALLWLRLVYIPDGSSNGSFLFPSLPVEYLPAVCARLRDSDLSVRQAALQPLQMNAVTGVGLDVITRILVPMLKDADVLREPADLRFLESNKKMIERMPPDQRAAFAAMPQKPILMPAIGPVLLSFLASPKQPHSDEVDDAMIAFLDRRDQTPSTLSDSLHDLALSSASERVNDEALRQVFAHKAMSVFLIQFLSSLRLTPTQLAENRQRLVMLSNDETADAQVRHAAATVSKCWDDDRHHACRPDQEDFMQRGASQ